MILRPPHLKCKCIYYVHDSCYFWRFSKSLCTTLLTLTWLVYLLEGSKCQGTLKRNVANLSTWNWNKITKLKKYQVAAFSTCFCPYPHLSLAMKNLLPMHSLGPLTQFNKCSFFFFFLQITGLKISCASAVCAYTQVAVLATCYFLDSGLAITLHFVPTRYLWSVLTAAKFEFWFGFNAFALTKTHSKTQTQTRNWIQGNFPGKKIC